MILGRILLGIMVLVLIEVLVECIHAERRRQERDDLRHITGARQWWGQR